MSFYRVVARPGGTATAGHYRASIEVPNGLALFAIHHKVFDRGSIDFDENMRAAVPDAVNGDDGRIMMLSSMLLTRGTLSLLLRTVAGASMV